MKIRDLFKDNVFTVSNFLTILRVAAIPFTIYYINLESITGDKAYTLYQLIFFIVIIFSDFFDGFIARTFNQVSRLGRFLDPVADKCCLITIGGSLVYYKGFPLWIFAVIIAREIFITISAVFLFYRRDVEVKPNMLGKLAVFFMSLTAILYLASIDCLILNFIDIRELSAYLTLSFYITGSFLYVKTYSVYYSGHESA